MEISNEQNSQAYRARPEPGQLVEVRRRQWVVADVTSSKFTSISAPQNLVSLSSIDEDGLGEELEVIWEIEPGAQIIERAGLPSITGQDDSDTLEAFLDAVRWELLPMPTEAFCKHRSAAVSALKISNSTHWFVPSTWRGSICSSPTTSVWARPLKQGWSSKRCCCGTVPAPFLSFVPHRCKKSGAWRCWKSSALISGLSTRATSSSCDESEASTPIPGLHILA